MNRIETIEIMAVLKAAYPRYYAGMGRKDAEGIIALWECMFADEPAQLVAAAVKSLIATDAKGFPPHIGAVKAAIARLRRPQELELGELEAWALVRRAIRGAYGEAWSRRLGEDGPGKTSAEENFGRLPPALQSLVGSPRQLAEWNRLDDEEIDTVLQSNFMRSFRAAAARALEDDALPHDVKRIALQFKQAPALQDGRSKEDE